MRITVRLLDADLIGKMEEIQKRDRSRITREALRAFLFGGNTNTREDTENPPRIDLSLSDDDLKGEELDLEENMDKMLELF